MFSTRDDVSASDYMQKSNCSSGKCVLSTSELLDIKVYTSYQKVCGVGFHHTTHLLGGFIEDPLGQLNASENVS